MIALALFAVLTYARVTELKVMHRHKHSSIAVIDVRGYVTDLCTKVVGVDLVVNGFDVDLTLRTVTKGRKCPQAIQEFSQVAKLNTYSLPAGTYTVRADGVSTTFKQNKPHTVIQKETTAHTL
mmetsp:Transcript_17914/g.32262  ORF Transcript_17914/g.32262 Transcript_17914/m.32262 type:complete len:123 (+) Transcript_17914:20-388(+)